MNTVSLCSRCAPLLEQTLTLNQMLKGMCKQCRFRTKVAQSLTQGQADDDGFVDLKSKLDRYGEAPIEKDSHE